MGEIDDILNEWRVEGRGRDERGSYELLFW